MAISSISTAVPTAPVGSTTPNPPQVKNDINPVNDTSTHQPTPPPPLPPGQGTRVDQYV
ncbi:MAG: hypothetical protein JOY90_28680 [Bradyrhizobium sp.]|uniref:hypothetical protein n=1 Tax=Bradyrhizobium sp. TaxID=376 RepID=UPI001D338398|nr:hypothetical protein [Bradyrhizobium sp.]MBV9564384.1 hypothetical protein [Bradyrhizobium sp.]